MAMSTGSAAKAVVKKSSAAKAPPGQAPPAAPPAAKARFTMRLAPSFVESQGMERKAVEMFHRRATARFDDARHKLQIAQAVFEEAKVHKEMADARLQQTGGSLEETEAPAEEKEDKEETAEDQGEEEHEEEEEPEEDGAMEEPEEEPSDERSDDRSEEREFIEGEEYIDIGSLERCQHKRCKTLLPSTSTNGSIATAVANVT